MAISILNLSDETRVSPSTSETYSHTVSSGSNTLLLVMIFGNPEVEPISFTATWDAAGANEPLTEIGAGHVQSNDSFSHAFYLVNPTPAVSSVTIQSSPSIDTGRAMAVVSYTLAGVDQSSPIRDEDGDAVDNGDFGTATVSTQSGDFLAIAAHQETTSNTVDFSGSTFSITLVQNGVVAGQSTFISGYGTADNTTETGEFNSSGTDHLTLQLVAVAPSAESSSSTSSSSSSSSSSISSSSSSSSSGTPCIPIVNSGATTQDSGSSQTSHVVTNCTHSAGDAIYIFAAIEGNHDMTSPSGFAAVFEDQLSTGNATTASLWRKVATDSEPVTYTWTSSSGERSVSICFSVRNDGGIDGVGTTNTADSSTATAPSIDTTNANDLILRLVWTDGETLPHTVDSTAYTEIASIQFFSGATESVKYIIQPEVGPTGTLDITLNGDAPQPWGAQTVAILPYCVYSSSSSSRSSSSSSSSSTSMSSSSSSATPGTVVWGHHTAVDEFYDLDFTGNTSGWTIGGTPGNDNEYIDATACNQIITFDPHYLGSMTAVIKVDKYMTGYGPPPIIEYRTATTKAALLVAAWSVYNGVSFLSLGWIQIRFIHV